MTKTVKIHSIVTLVLTILFVSSLIWTFNTREENKSLALKNDQLEIAVSELQTINKEYQAYYVSIVDSLNKMNDSLNKQLVVKQQELKVISERETSINKKYRSLYEKIKVTDDINAQYDITEELLSEQRKLIERAEDKRINR